MGGGGSSRNFSGSPLRTGSDSVGRGVVAEIFPVADQSHSLNSGTFFYIFGPPADHPPFMDTHGNSGTLPRYAYTFKERNNINSFHTKIVYQKLRHCHDTRISQGLRLDI